MKQFIVRLKPQTEYILVQMCDSVCINQKILIKKNRLYKNSPIMRDGAKSKKTMCQTIKREEIEI